MNQQEQTRLYEKIRETVETVHSYEDFVLRQYSKEDLIQDIFLKVMSGHPSDLTSLLELDRKLWVNARMSYVRQPFIEEEVEKIEKPLTINPVIAMLIKESKKRFETLTTPN